MLLSGANSIYMVYTTMYQTAGMLLSCSCVALLYVLIAIQLLQCFDYASSHHT